MALQKICYEIPSQIITQPRSYSPICYFCYIYILFPLSFACVEHFFKKMKQIKTHLWNRLAKVQLDQLLRTDAESLKESYHYTIY